MVLDSDKYVAAGTHKPKAKASSTKQVQDIAITVIKHLWTDVKTTTKVFHKKETDGSNSQIHPGEHISRDQLLTCLKEFTTFLIVPLHTKSMLTIHIYPEYPYLYNVLLSQHQIR
jgi:hypothetical protein